jgi:hypothetical protein
MDAITTPDLKVLLTSGNSEVSADHPTGSAIRLMTKPYKRAEFELRDLLEGS